MKKIRNLTVWRGHVTKQQRTTNEWKDAGCDFVEVSLSKLAGEEGWKFKFNFLILVNWKLQSDGLVQYDVNQKILPVKFALYCYNKWNINFEVDGLPYNLRYLDSSAPPDSFTNVTIYGHKANGGFLLVVLTAVLA